MADQLVTAEELRVLLGLTTIDTARANLVIAACTAVVQEAAEGQRLIAVAGDAHTMMGVTSCWLDLPQRPVTAVTAVTLDGTTQTLGTGLAANTYKWPGRGAKLWRNDGWQTYWDVPSEAGVTYSHGYAAGDQNLELGRGACFGLSRGIYVNPDGVTSEKIDDYAVAYERASAEMAASPYLKRALTRKYGIGVSLVQVGG